MTPTNLKEGISPLCCLISSLEFQVRSVYPLVYFILFHSGPLFMKCDVSHSLEISYASQGSLCERQKLKLRYFLSLSLSPLNLFCAPSTFWGEDELANAMPRPKNPEVIL